MSIEFNAENRNANMATRCCSFCRRAGHNITRCDSQAIRIFERNALNYMNFNMSVEIMRDRQRSDFRNYLLNEALTDSNLVRAFAISRCGASTRSNLASCIDLIIQYFMPEDEYININFENTQEAQPAEPAPRTNLRVGRRFGLGRGELERGGLEAESILYAMMFIEMIRSINGSSETNIDRKFYIKTKISENQEDLEEKCECNICYDMHEKQKFIKLDCGHEFCKDCIKQSLQNERRETPCCAFCRADIKNLELRLESIKNGFDKLITSEHQS